MTVYYVNSASASPGGSGTSNPWSEWQYAAHSFYDFQSHGTYPVGTSGSPFLDGDIIYVASTSTDSGTWPAATTSFYGPNTAGAVAKIISTNDTTNMPPTTYAQGTNYQLIFNGGNYTFTFLYNWAIDGLRAQHSATNQTGSFLQRVDGSKKGFQIWSNCYWKLGPGGYISTNNTNGGYNTVIGGTIDISADTSTSYYVIGTGGYIASLFISDVAIVGASSYRSQYLLQTAGSGDRPFIELCNIDFSSFSSVSTLSQYGLNGGAKITNCKFPSGMALTPTGPTSIGQYCHLWVVNCGTDDEPEKLHHETMNGSTTSNTTNVRTGSAAVESNPVSWVLFTPSWTTEFMPYKGPWIYGVLSSTGTKTFSVYIQNNSAALNENEIWLEVDVMPTAGSPKGARWSDYRGGDGTGRANILTGTTGAQATDSSGVSWTTDLTYQQVLSVANVTVGEEGQFRARVCLGKPSVASTIYVDPKVTVT